MANGKGDKPRAILDQEGYDRNWEMIFCKKGDVLLSKMKCIKCGLLRSVYDLKPEPGIGNPDYSLGKCSYGHYWGYDEINGGAMMKKIVSIVILLIVLSIPCYAVEYEIRPRMMDFSPNDGFMDAGSYSNPYVVSDRYGRERGTIRSRTMDFDPNDGFMDAGTWSNPYVYSTDEY